MFIQDIMSSTPSIIINSTRGAGFYSALLGIIYEAYEHIENGIVPYILWQNPKYMAKNDDNVYDYFFKQGSKPTVVTKVVEEKGMRVRVILERAKKNNRTFREQMHDMFKTVCVIHPNILSEINDYASQYDLTSKDAFHIRQTDRYVGGKGLIYAGPDMTTIINYMNENCMNDFYVATDCKDTMENVSKQFSCFSYATLRSSGTRGIHYSNVIKEDNKKIGFEAFVEGLLLSKCKCVHRVTSNFTTFSLIVNPDIPYVDLSMKFKDVITKQYNIPKLTFEDFLGV